MHIKWSVFEHSHFSYDMLSCPHFALHVASAAKLPRPPTAAEPALQLVTPVSIVLEQPANKTRATKAKTKINFFILTPPLILKCEIKRD